MNTWLKWRLDNIVPMLMRREGIDMWLVINREYNEDPVYLSTVPEPHMAASRTSILIFRGRGEDKGVERLSGGYQGIGTGTRRLGKTKPRGSSRAWLRSLRAGSPRNWDRCFGEMGFW